MQDRLVVVRVGQGTGQSLLGEDQVERRKVDRLLMKGDDDHAALFRCRAEHGRETGGRSRRFEGNVDTLAARHLHDRGDDVCLRRIKDLAGTECPDRLATDRGRLDHDDPLDAIGDQVQVDADPDRAGTEDGHCLPWAHRAAADGVVSDRQ